MSEVVASHAEFRAPSLAAPTPDIDRLREQVTDFEQLVETLLEKYEEARRENERLRAENRALRDENERLRKG